MAETRPGRHAPLAGFYFLFFAVNGILLPYWGLYLQRRGFDAGDIGTLIALGFIVKLIAPNLWAWLADRSARRLPLLRIAAAAAGLSLCGVYLADTLAAMGLVLLAFHFFWQALLPQFEALTLAQLERERQAHRYSQVRLWGSIGFMLATAAAGATLPMLGLQRLPLLLIVGIAALALLLWRLRADAGVGAGAEVLLPGPSLGDLLRRPPVLALLAVALLVQASHGPYYGFFSIHIERLGYSGGAIGLLWALGVAAEIVVFLLAPGWLRRIGARQLLLLTLALSAMRWLLIGVAADSPPLLLTAQLLHGFSFGLHHVVSIQLIHRWFSGAVQSRGQALYASLGFGVGGALGVWFAGQLWTTAGPAAVFAAAAGLSLFALLLVALWLRPSSATGIENF